jgi:hypothetical protein
MEILVTLALEQERLVRRRSNFETLFQVDDTEAKVGATSCSTK